MNMEIIGVQIDWQCNMALPKQATLIEAVSFWFAEGFNECLKMCLDTDVVGKYVIKYFFILKF